MVLAHKVECWGGTCSCGSPFRNPHGSVSFQEDVLNTQCGYDIRLKLVRGLVRLEARDRTGVCMEVGSFLPTEEQRILGKR